MIADDRGQLAGGEAIPFGLLIFVVGTLLIANAWAVVDAKFAVDASAQAAARAFSETTASDYGTARERAIEVGQTTFAGYGRDPERVDIDLLDRPSDERPVTRCDRVTFEAQYVVPAINLPFIGGYGSGFTVTAIHARTVDPLRSGVQGEATCL